MVHYIWLAIALPLAGALINGLLGRYLGRRAVNVLGPAGVGLAFLVGVLVFFELHGLPVESRAVTVNLWQWITIGKMSVGATLLADPLSLLMVLVVTGVGFLIHVYSVGYMEHEDGRMYARFFAYLNLFVASMLVLVLADNYLLMYVGWELVGLCSYLLIGFWFHRGNDEQAPIELADGELVPLRPNLNPSDSGKKAFIVNRVGGFRLRHRCFPHVDRFRHAELLRGLRRRPRRYRWPR